MGKLIERIFKKNSLKPNAPCHNNVSGCTDTGGFLEHSSSGGSLYYKGPPEDNSGVLGVPPIYTHIYTHKYVYFL